MPEKAIVPVTGLILAGGKGRRMGGLDKGLLQLNHKPLYQLVYECLQQQVDHILISANRHQDQYRQSACPVISDEFDNFQGPLAGILAGLKAIETGYLLVVPCDSPVFPDDLLQRMQMAMDSQSSNLAIAHDGQRLQPLFALISKALQGSLEEYLSTGHRRVSDWFLSENAVIVEFEPDPHQFKNVNTPEDFVVLADKLS